MLCQNCEKNEATTHIKRVINGDTAESHLCSDCAAHLGYGDFFSGFGLNIGDIFGGFLEAGLPGIGETNVKRCQKCGCSFEDIARDGKLGCAECYNTFYDKLLPSLQRIHGRIQHNGKMSDSCAEEVRKPNRLEQLREEIKTAIAEQNFELAAKLRDEIKEMEKEG
ncbi:MAG: UvrB/UvrC motif-containing protein [Eubacteriales bacterium]